MTAATLPSPTAWQAPATGAVRGVGRFFLALAAFLGAFVIEEPAPYELLLVAMMGVWLLFGLRLDRFAIALAGLFVLFNVGGLGSMLTMDDPTGIPLYLAVSLFLGFTSVFWCAIVTADMGRLRLVMRAYAVGATITAALGVLGYFNVFAGFEVFTRYDRAKGAFQDPNVFGPFLVLPMLYLLNGLLTRSDGATPFRAAMLAVMLLGLFLSFSRAAWGLLILSGAAYYAITLATASDPRTRLRMVLLGLAGLLGALAMLAVALQIDAVAQMFEQRAGIQEYDSAHDGRFARHLVGFGWALQHPLGIGPLEFGKRLGEDTHNIWLKALMAYGWLGFFTWVSLVVVTLVAGWRLLGRVRPWQTILVCLYAAFVGHLVIGWVIDVDHWRHVYMIIGLIWGCMALEARYGRGRQQE